MSSLGLGELVLDHDPIKLIGIQNKAVKVYFGDSLQSTLSFVVIENGKEEIFEEGSERFTDVRVERCVVKVLLENLNRLLSFLLVILVVD